MCPRAFGNQASGKTLGMPALAQQQQATHCYLRPRLNSVVPDVIQSVRLLLVFIHTSNVARHHCGADLRPYHQKPLSKASTSAAAALRKKTTRPAP